LRDPAARDRPWWCRHCIVHAAAALARRRVGPAPGNRAPDPRGIACKVRAFECRVVSASRVTGFSMRANIARHGGVAVARSPAAAFPSSHADPARRAQVGFGHCNSALAPPTGPQSTARPGLASWRRRASKLSPWTGSHSRPLRSPALRPALSRPMHSLGAKQTRLSEDTSLDAWPGASGR